MGNKEINFTLSHEAKALGIKCAVFSMHGLNNKLNHPKFELYKNELFATLKQEYDENSLVSDPILAGFNELHEKIGSSNQKLIASPQSLISILLRKGCLPQINLLVDIYNCISIQSKLSLGAHDIKSLQGDVSLRLTDGTESFIPLGKNKLEKINPGEYCYVQENDDVICRLECRQADATKITLETTEALFIIQGNKASTYTYLESTMNNLISSITTYCGGTVKVLLAPGESC